MNKNKKNIKNIPELRFPEFKNAGEWVEKKLGEIAKSINSQIAKNKLKFNEIGFPVYGADGLLGYIETFEQENDYIAIVKDGSGVGTIFYCNGKSSLLGTLNYMISKNNKNYNLKWIYYLLNIIDFRPFIKGSGIPHIYFKDYSKLYISVPTLPEQQKIAGFLSNLDELIEAHKQKLKLLKQHKKGLMQNLFPKQGEKKPKLRFPEFKNDGEWVEKKLGEIGEPLMCKRIFKKQTISNSFNGIPFYKIGTFGGEADSYITVDLYNEYKEKYNFPNKGDILISASGTIGRLVIYDGLPAYFQDSNIVWLGHNETQVVNNFFYYCYSIVNWQTSDGGVIKRLYNSDLKNVKIIFPKNKEEQQKIASFLSSLDELIKAEAEKIEQLEKHKKGLMQKMFCRI